MVIADPTSRVSPLDAREQQDQADILRWVQSGAPLFRTALPTTPPQHLAVYFALFDAANQALMLVDHVKAAARPSSTSARGTSSVCPAVGGEKRGDLLVGMNDAPSQLAAVDRFYEDRSHALILPAAQMRSAAGRPQPVIVSRRPVRMSWYSTP